MRLRNAIRAVGAALDAAQRRKLYRRDLERLARTGDYLIRDVGLDPNDVRRELAHAARACSVDRISQRVADAIRAGCGAAVRTLRAAARMRRSA